MFFATRPEVLLASDPNCDRAATALCVGVGRLHEPKEWGKIVAAKVEFWNETGRCKHFIEFILPFRLFISQKHLILISFSLNLPNHVTF